MPCYGYSIPAKHCKTGSKLRNMKGSVCQSCYALKGRYVFPNVLDAMEKRLESIESPTWVDDMVELIGRKEKSGHFRWHDSGDIQSVEHLLKIEEIAKRLPHIKFWLPTREIGILKSLDEKSLKRIRNRPNLIIRVSAFFKNSKFSKRPLGFNTSSVTDDKKESTCKAYDNDGKCGDCRACWNKRVPNIAYPSH